MSLFLLRVFFSFTTIAHSLTRRPSLSSYVPLCYALLRFIYIFCLFRSAFPYPILISSHPCPCFCLPSLPTAHNRANHATGFEDSIRTTASSSLRCNEERMSSIHPAALQITSGSNGRTPCSRDSSFGRASGGGSGGGRARGGGGSGGGGSLFPLPPPPPLTGAGTGSGTPRRSREKYILLDELGSGGGGTVHKALHVPSMRLVAVKMVEVHNDEKRRQVLKELTTLLSMKPVGDERRERKGKGQAGRVAGSIEGAGGTRRRDRY